MTTRETELLAAQVAALELEVVRLRSVMADVIKAHGYTGGTPIEVLSTPFAPTADGEQVERWEPRIGTLERKEWQEDENRKARARLDAIPIREGK